LEDVKGPPFYLKFLREIFFSKKEKLGEDSVVFMERVCNTVFQIKL